MLPKELPPERKLPTAKRQVGDPLTHMEYKRVYTLLVTK
jgi:hypothetical protein